MKNGGWRLLRLLARALLDAIAPSPTIADLQMHATALQRHAAEPPRRRRYQNVVMVS